MAFTKQTRECALKINAAGPQLRFLGEGLLLLGRILLAALPVALVYAFWGFGSERERVFSVGVLIIHQ